MGHTYRVYGLTSQIRRAQRFRWAAISPKVRGDFRRGISVTFYRRPAVLFSSLRHNA